MDRIRKDVALLKGQGYNPHVWLEFVSHEGEIMYFDGICHYFKVEADFPNAKENHLFIHIPDIECFHEGSLYALHELNLDHYNKNEQYFVRGYSFCGLAEIGVNYVTSNYVTLTTDAIRGDAMSLDTDIYVSLTNITYTPDIDSDEYEEYENYDEDSDEECGVGEVTYQDGLDFYYDDVIHNPVTSNKDKFGQLPEGTYYFLPKMLAKDAQFVEEDKPFYPNKYVSLVRDMVLLFDRSTSEQRTFYLPHDFGRLRKYSKDIEGLSYLLDDFVIKASASNLMGEGAYEDFTENFERYTDKYRVGKTANRLCKYYFDLPDNSQIVFDYCSACNKTAQIVDLEGNMEYETVSSLVDCVTPINENNDGVICAQNNIVVIKPMFVSKIEYIDGVLHILVRCVVNFPDMPYKEMDLPLCVLDKNGQTFGNYGLIHKWAMGSLQVPYICYNYLYRNTTLEEVFKGLNIKKMKLRTYKTRLE